MKIDKYISELLFDHECVIVPGLGGFIINDRHASIDRITHQFNPPFKKILFNQHIRFNDGLLLNYIASKEGLSFEAVRKQMDEMVHQYFVNLENGEKIKFENIGILAFDKNNNITFDQEFTVNFNAESFGLGSFVSPPIKRKTESKGVKGIVQPQPTIEKREDRKPEREAAKNMEPMHKRRNKSESASVRSFVAVTLAVILLASVALAYFNSESTRSYLQNLLASLTVKTEKSRYIPRSEPNNQTKDVIANQAGFLSGTIFDLETPNDANISKPSTEEIQAEKKYITGEISVSNYFNYRGRNLTERADEVLAETKREEPENIVVENVEVEVAENNSTVSKEEIVLNINAVSQYYIIAGSFSQESNAMSLIDELLKKGFSAQIIDTNKSGMYRVAYLGIENFNDAKQKLYAIRKEDNPDAWILKK